MSQGESCPGLHATIDGLAWWPSPYWVGGPSKDTQSGTNMHCDKGHSVVTRATATGAEDMAIRQGRHQRSRWSRPGSCRTRTVPVIPRSARRVPVEISHPQWKRGNRRSSLKKETQWGSLTPHGRDKVQEHRRSREPEMDRVPPNPCHQCGGCSAHA